MESWERLDSETNPAWAAFQVYRDMPAEDRSYDAAYRLRYDKPKEHRAPGYFRRWAQDNDWPKRAAAYDRHTDKIKRQALEDRRLQARIETADLGETLRKKAMNAARALTAVTQRAGVIGGKDVWILGVELSANEIARLAATGVELERLALGETTEHLELTSGGGPIAIREVIVELTPPKEPET